MGAAGSDVAIETANIALMNDDICKINYLIDLSRKTMDIVKQNVSVALFIQVPLSVFAVFGFVSLWMAVIFGDMGLTLAVILNALELDIINKGVLTTYKSVKSMFPSSPYFLTLIMEVKA